MHRPLPLVLLAALLAVCPARAEEPSPEGAPEEPAGAALAEPAPVDGAEDPVASRADPASDTDADAPAAEAAEAAEAPAAAEAPKAARPARRRRSTTERWIREQVPDDLEKMGPFGIEWWQWIAFPLLGLVSAGAGRVLGSATRAGLLRVARATTPTWDDELLEQSAGPLYLACALGVAWALLGFLFLRAQPQALTADGLQIGLLVALLWVAFRAVDIGGMAVTRAALAQGHAGAVSVVPLVARSSKIALVALGVVAVLSSLGYPVTSLLAGLGIGGLALALAAQKTAENMFGSVSLGVDQPLRVGDLVKIEDFLGTVEAIGLRSTRFRTTDRTIVTIPNGRLADMKIENFTVRDRMRVHCVLALELTTPPEKVKAVVAGIEAAIRAHPKHWAELVQVRLNAVGPHALDVYVSAWFLVNDPDQLLLIRQELLYAFLDVVAASGARLAFPTQTVHVVRDPA